jgi:LysM repeat protein
LPPFGHPAAPAPADDEAIEYDSDDLASLLGRAASRRGPVDEDADPTGLPGSVPDGPPRRTSTWDWSAPPPWTAGGRADRADPRDGSPRLTDDEQGRPGSRVEDPSRGLADLLSSDDDDFDAPDADDLGSLHEVRSGPVRAQPGRARSLSDMLGWDRRPRAGSPVRPPIVGQQPPWEHPRRYEAYPSLRTRVGLSLPPRIVLGAVALVVTAVTLFFVPPLLLNQDPGGAPGRTREPGASTASLSPSADASPLPTATPVPTPGGRTYTVKSGDTLSKIAKKYGLTIEQVLAANKAIKDPNRIAIGDVIVIPSAAPSAIVDTGPTATP